ncbi:MAG: hypothetical protein DYG89_31180 [Caldilinea sp. CFX5]|nr:hypothetical protein [Caldilinea sp. CFX5]
MTTVVIDVPPDLYQLAQQTAHYSRQPIEQVLLDWIQPPVEAEQQQWEDEFMALEQASSSKLIQVAKSSMARQDVERLQTLLTLQQQRTLTPKERREAEQLVKQEDLQTLRKAKALYLLKQRNALPADLIIPGI